MRIGFIVDVHDNPKTMDWLAEAVERYDAEPAEGAHLVNPKAPRSKSRVAEARVSS